MRFVKFIIPLLILPIVYFVCMQISNKQLATSDFLNKKVYPGSYDHITTNTEQSGLYALIYKVKLKYPSKKILDFYDKEFAHQGWAKFSDNKYYGDAREWESFIDETQKGEPLIHQIIAFWINDNKEQVYHLVLRYFSYNYRGKNLEETENPESDVQYVHLQLLPYIKDLEDLKIFEKKE